MHRVLCVMLISIWMLMSPRQLCDSHFRLGGMVHLLKWKKNLRKQAIAMVRIVAVLLRVTALDLSTFQLSFAVLQAATFQWSPYPAPEWIPLLCPSLHQVISSNITPVRSHPSLMCSHCQLLKCGTFLPPKKLSCCGSTIIALGQDLCEGEKKKGRCGGSSAIAG